MWQNTDTDNPKEAVEAMYESNASDKLSQYRKRTRNSEYADINEALYKWYQLATSKNIFPDGKILMEKALEIANRLGVESFKASNGWLTRWKQRHNIKQRTVSGESGDVSSETVESWLERVPSVIEGYEARNIWNTDETGYVLLVSSLHTSHFITFSDSALAPLLTHTSSCSEASQAE